MCTHAVADRTLNKASLHFTKDHHGQTGTDWAREHKEDPAALCVSCAPDPRSAHVTVTDRLQAYNTDFPSRQLLLAFSRGGRGACAAPDAKGRPTARQ